jgi:iron complex outermembrane receptor protein
MNLPSDAPARFLTTLRCALLWVLGVASAWCQSPASGTVSGRVFNPITREFVRDAEIRVEGTALITSSEAGGHYTLAQVPAGTARITTTFAGYPAVTHAIVVSAGQTVVRDFELAPAGAGGGVVKLGAFVVTSGAEGQAKQIMNQRNSMSLGTSLSSDVFGDVTEGNVGEFLKYLPGIEMETVEADTRGPRLGGMNPEYAGVSVDGMKSASADGFGVYGATTNGAAGSATRSFSFEQVSINSIESIEISRVTPADLDGDAIAGTINLKMKRAFDTRGRRLTWALSGGFNSEEMTLRRTPGPDDSHGRKVRPTASLNYSESFLEGRLGVLVGLSESNLYNEQQRVQNAYGAGTGLSAGQQVVTSVIFKDGPKWTERQTATLTVDYKATASLILSLSGSFNGYEMFAYNRLSTLTTGANQLAGSDTLTIRTATGAANLNNGNGNINKRTMGYAIIPKFEYRWRSLTVDGAYSASVSRNTYGALRNGMAGNAQVNALGSLTVTATRPSITSSAWQVVQTGGQDWTNLAAYTFPRLTDDIRYVYNEVTNASVNTKWNTPLRWPTFLKFGTKRQERITNADNKGALATYNYVGPGGGTTGSYAAFPTPFVFSPDALGVSFRSLNGGGGPAYANRDAVGQLFKSNPESFVNTATPENYYTAAFAQRKRFTELIPSAYLLGNTRVAAWQFQAGLRWEQTRTVSREFNPLPVSQVAAAGFPVNRSTGRATTVAGLDYQYRSKPMVDREGRYENYFPSVTAKYRFSDDLIADVGYGRAISRPNVLDLSGLMSINETTQTLTVSNPNLKPENSERLAASLAHYLRGTGSVRATFTETRIRNLKTLTEFTAAEYGIDDPSLAGYTVITNTQGPGTRRFRSMELEYRQRLGFLPPSLGSTSAFASYTRTYASERRVGLTPHVITGGVDYRFRLLSLGLKTRWEDQAPWSNATRYRPQVIRYDGNLDLRLNRRLTLFVQARNIFNRDYVVLEGNGNLFVAENYGSNWVIGLRGEF